MNVKPKAIHVQREPTVKTKKDRMNAFLVMSHVNHRRDALEKDQLNV